jgi:hypothetical protein
VLVCMGVGDAWDARSFAMSSDTFLEEFYGNESVGVCFSKFSPECAMVPFYKAYRMMY